MAGSVNKVTALPSRSTGSPAVKSCERCGAHFKKPRKYSSSQWEGKRFCSRRCGALKRKVSDAEVVAQYNNGHSSGEIAETLGLSGTHVLRILKGNGVEIRSQSEGMKLSHARPEVRRKMSASATGRTLPEEAKDKLRSIVGPLHQSWKAGITITGGYLQFTSSPANGAHAGKLLHRVIAEWKIGRPIKEGEHVHHKDGNKLNNHPDNLQVMTASDHLRLHAIQNGLGKRKGKVC